MAVRTTEIVGSVGRCSEFDGAFMPINGRARARWQRKDRAFRRGEELPLVSLYKIGDSYFVQDGNHRVSVARYHGVPWIDAEVTVFRVRPPRDGRGDGSSRGRDPKVEERVNLSSMLEVVGLPLAIPPLSKPVRIPRLTGWAVRERYRRVGGGVG
ncbi:MAG: hypothetical protein M3151_03810, partial [Actinomycetota bacterium]|nr:hypothetical protein [Actinomycetota bacterium]